MLFQSFVLFPNKCHAVLSYTSISQKDIYINKMFLTKKKKVILRTDYWKILTEQFQI